MLEASGKLSPKGADISMDTWLTSSFHLPFKTSFELESYSGLAAERIKQQPIGANDKYSLYLKFAQATTYVIRVIVFYRVQRYIQINSQRNVFKSHELEQ